MEKVTLLATCGFCKKDKELEVTAEGYKKYEKGAKIIEAFPELSAADRELLISQTCGDCWDKMFGKNPFAE
ncbi:hypothetical protein COF68_05750 [Bacillus toyonensis]|uniref:hypothetical protein n=1 Tax=Bacillus toyonensis TaxID=155322 RepID=UPI000BFE9A7A|nr:hypothetical protein [Bacillus toyonensis]PHE64344.1 hypothetical protein COF68_05750 [Bacillus toyonensis]